MQEALASCSEEDLLPGGDSNDEEYVEAVPVVERRGICSSFEFSINEESHRSVSGCGIVFHAGAVVSWVHPTQYLATLSIDSTKSEYMYR